MHMHGFKYLDIPRRVQKKMVLMLPIGRTEIRGEREICQSQYTVFGLNVLPFACIH